MAPLNDNFADAIELVGASGEITFDITDATREADEPPQADGHSVWFYWVAPADGDVVFDTASTPPPRWDSTIAVYTGTSLLDLVEVTEDDDGGLQPGVVTDDGYGTSTLTFTATAGVTYWVQVDSYDYPADDAWPTSGNPSAGYPRSDCVLTWTTSAPPPPPPPSADGAMSLALAMSSATPRAGAPAAFVLSLGLGAFWLLPAYPPFQPWVVGAIPIGPPPLGQPHDPVRVTELGLEVALSANEVDRRVTEFATEVAVSVNEVDRRVTEFAVEVAVSG